MNRKNHRLCTAVIAPALLALSLLTSSCVEPLDPSLRGSTDPNAVLLPIRLYIPGAMPATKAGSGDVSGVSPESQIYSIQVWMYDHATGTEATDNNQKPVSYAQAYLGWNQQDNLGKWDKSGYYASGRWTSDQIYELLFKIPNSVIESTRPMKFDFYVLANGTSIGSSGSPATPTMTRGELKALKFGNNGTDDFFGSTNPVTVTMTDATEPLALGQDGLPISGFFNKSRKADGTIGAANGVDLSFLRDKIKPATGDDDPARPYTNDEIKAMSPVIQLERAVSKIRFAFARPTGMTGIQITRIEIGQFNGTDPKTASVTGGLIPKTTFVFPREDGTDFELPSGSSGVEYDASVATIGSDDNPLFNVPLNYSGDDPIIAVVPDPKALESTSETVFTKPDGSTENKSYYGYAPNGMSAQRYSDLLDDFTTSQIVYFRETDKPVQGKIYFKLTPNGSELSAPFYMPAQPNTETNFHRNHSWIVYAYFLGGKLFVKPTVAAWDDAPELTYTLKMNTNMRLFDSWLYRYDTDGKNYLAVDSDNKPLWNNWATSHMAVSSGRENLGTEEDPVWGRALRSPLIQLVTTGVADANVAGSGTFELRIDNSGFEIVKAVKNNVGVVTSYEASTDIFEESVYQYGSLTIPAGDDVYTYFYIVPKVGVTPSNPEAKVTLFYNDPVLGLVKVTFNYSSLPGYSDDSSEIWAYYFPADDYRIIKDANNKPDKLRMYYQDYNNPLVPTPVQ